MRRFYSAWGNLDDATDYRLIIDCLLNIPLLYWASEVTSDNKYHNIAYRHYNTTINNIFREDGSSYHTIIFDKETGKPVKGVTRQGYSDESCWSRGQAWALYGVPLTNKYHYSEDSISVFNSAAAYYLNRLPEDFVPFGICVLHMVIC
jgi:unsaturated chondroitin disaccharide hydrolase